MAAVSRQLQQYMQSMMDKLMQIEMTGDADHDYARMIVQYYTDTIARVETQYGKNVELIYMAQKIIDDGQKEIDQLQT